MQDRWTTAHLVAFFGLIGLIVLLGWTPPCEAGKDVRLALLVANQVGWKQDPRLNYVLSGDLKPMARSLRGLGFQLHTVLPNQGPEALRKALKRLKQRLRRSPKVTTFFFYYSGHADKRYFHMGPRGKRPFNYKELIHFFANIKVRRRFAVIDACFSGEIIRQFGSLSQFRSLRSQGHLKAKGVEPRLVVSDLRKYLPDQGSQAHGLQILSSSRHLSFESSKRKGSVFTYHFLRGLKGAADLDKDGKIAMNELFLYTKSRVKKETGQSPQQWLFREGGETYGFAPAYKTILQFSPRLRGKLQVSVGGFVWRWHKRTNKPLRLAVSAGQGEILLKHQKRCFRGQMNFPANGRASITSHQLTAVPCSSALRSKAGVRLPTRLAPPLDQTQGWSLGLQGGPWLTSGLLRRGGDVGGGGSISLRRRFFALTLGAHAASVRFSQQDRGQLLLDLRAALGYRQLWGRFDLFAGGFASVGLLLQDINTTPSPAPLFQLGATIQGAIWLHERWAISLAVDAALIPTIVGSELRPFFSGAAKLGLMLAL